MIDISQIATRVDSLLQNQQDNHVFVTSILRKNALELLDKKFEKAEGSPTPNLIGLGIQTGCFLAGAVATLAKHPNGQNVQNDVISDMNSDVQEKEHMKLVCYGARDKTIQLQIDQLYQLIFLLKNKNITDVLEFLKINPDLIV